MTKEEANEVWHQLMEESEVPPSLRGSEKIRTQMDENVTAAETGRSQLVLRDTEKIRERRLPVLASYLSVDVSAVKEGALHRSLKIIKLIPNHSYKVELWELSSGTEVKLVEGAPHLEEIVGANCYDPDQKPKPKMGKRMRIQYFRKEDGSHLKMKTLGLDFQHEQQCENAQIAIVKALADQKDLDCVPGGDFIKAYSQGSVGVGVQRPMWCSHWCARAFEPFDGDLKGFKPGAGAGMFWSTGAKGSGRRTRDNMNDAQKFAKDRGFLTLEQTVMGKILDEPNMFAQTYPGEGKEIEINKKKVWISNLNHVAYLLNCGSMEIAKETGRMIAENELKGEDQIPVHVYAEEANAVSPYALLNTIPTWYNIELPSMIGAYLDTRWKKGDVRRNEALKKKWFASASSTFFDDGLLDGKLLLTYHWRAGAEVKAKRLVDGKTVPNFTAKEVLSMYYTSGKAFPSYGEDAGMEIVETLCNSDRVMGKGGDACHPFSRFGRKACGPGLKCVNKNRLHTDAEHDYECSSGESRHGNTEFDPCVYDSDCANGYACYWKDGLDANGETVKEPIGAVCQIVIGVPLSRERDLCYSPGGRCTKCKDMQREFKTILHECKCETKINWADWDKPWKQKDSL